MAMRLGITYEGINTISNINNFLTILSPLGRGNKIIYVLLLTCIILLINPIQCGPNFNYFGEPNGQHLFKTDKNVIITYRWDYAPQQLESYTVSAGKFSDQQPFWTSTVTLNDLSPGEHSPINGTFGSPNLGRLNPSTDYYVRLTTNPIGNASKSIDYSEPFFVASNPGYVTIIKFNDKNGDKIRESDEDGLGGVFTISGDNGFTQSVTVGSNGTSTIPLPPGLYKITESIQNCWKPTSDAVQQVSIAAGNTIPMYFGNIPDTELTLTIHNDTNGNGIYDIGEPGVSGVAFTISDVHGTQLQSLISGPNGSVRFNGVPGASYTITATPPENMDLIGSNSASANPCETKLVEFLAKRVVWNITGLLPTNNATIGSRDVLFSWMTPGVNSSSEVYLNQEGSGTYYRYIGPEGINHAISVPNLTRNKWYNFYVKSEAGYRVKQSEFRKFFISNGIIFSPRYYNFTVERNVSQGCTVTVKNTDAISHKLHLNVTNSYDDIYLGFLGYSSADREVTLQPGETKDVELVIHAQDALSKVPYHFIVSLNSLDHDPIVDNALVDVRVKQPTYDFNITVVKIDPFTQIKTLEVTNLGDPITDLSIVPDEGLRKSVVIQPAIYHSSLGRNASLMFSVSPIWSGNMGPIGGNLIATAGNIKKLYPIDFTCSEGNRIFPVKLHNLTIYFNWNVNQCINAGPIAGTFLLPAGLKAGDVKSAQISMELDPRSPKFQTERYTVWVDINNHMVGNINNTIPSGRYVFEMNRTQMNYTDAGTALNSYLILNNMQHSYTTMLSDVRLKLCVNELTLHICAGNQTDAERIAWTAPWIYRPSSTLNVRVLSPEKGSTLPTGKGATIRAEVIGTNGGERHCDAFATFSNGDKPVWLIENENEDGSYTCSWTPENVGPCQIKVDANNCVGSASNQTEVTITQSYQNTVNSDINILKTTDPAVLNADEINITNGTLIRYNITLCPTAGALDGVKVVDTIPSYMELKSVDPKANITYNHDGKAWSTTNVTWDLGDLDTCKSVSLSAAFSWRFPAEVNHIAGAHLPVSEVTYINPARGIGRLAIPEGEIKIAVPSQKPGKTPGFEGWVAIVGIIAMMCLLRRHNEEA
jgi:hypothetical protein